MGEIFIEERFGRKILGPLLAQFLTLKGFFTG